MKATRRAAFLIFENENRRDVAADILTNAGMNGLQGQPSRTTLEFTDAITAKQAQQILADAPDDGYKKPTAARAKRIEKQIQSLHDLSLNPEPFGRQFFRDQMDRWIEESVKAGYRIRWSDTKVTVSID